MFTKSTAQRREKEGSRSNAANTRSGGRSFPAVPVFHKDVVQRVRLVSGLDTVPVVGTFNVEVPELKVLEALYKKLSGAALQDFPLPPRIESGPNTDRLNRSDTTALGEERVLGDKPINDLWQLVIDFKKHRALASVNIKSNTGEGLASAVYNQYGKTQTKWENTDVLIYKHPERNEEEEEKTESDKGVSYKLAATKFEEMRKALAPWGDKEIAGAILQYYKDGVLPQKVVDAGQTRNFGYITTLMLVPESARSVGTFTFGLILLDNIKSGAETANEAFLPAAGVPDGIAARVKARKKEKKLLKKEKELRKEKKKVPRRTPDPLSQIPTYKDDPDLGGTYAPAFTGSKAPLNWLESESETQPLALATKENKGSYLWNTTLKRYTNMVKTFLAQHPELTGFEIEIDDEGTLINLLVDRILTHFGIGEGILSDTTRQHEVRRSTNNILFGTQSTVSNAFIDLPPTPGSPLGEYQELVETHVQDPFLDRAVVKEAGDDEVELKSAFGTKQGKKRLKRDKKKKEVLKTVLVGLTEKKRKRKDSTKKDKDKEQPEKSEVKEVRIDPRVFKKKRLQIEIEDVLSGVLEAHYSSDQPISYPDVIEVTKAQAFSAYTGTIEELGLGEGDVEQIVTRSLKEFLSEK